MPSHSSLLANDVAQVAGLLQAACLAFNSVPASRLSWAGLAQLHTPVACHSCLPQVVFANFCSSPGWQTTGEFSLCCR